MFVKARIDQNSIPAAAIIAGHKSCITSAHRQHDNFNIHFRLPQLYG